MSATATSSLQSFQDDFYAALFGDADAASRAEVAGQPGFDVYRNTVMSACIDALADNHPTVVQLVGDDWFRSAAAVFVRSNPPHDGGLGSYGEGFAGFLAAFEPARELEYLPGVARLDRLWMEAHLAADAPLLDGAALAATAPEVLAGAVLVPHPAARWAGFADMPVYTIWRRHREGESLSGELSWRGERALLTRAGGAVSWRALAPAGAAFLDACRHGLGFADAVESAGAECPGAEESLAAWLPGLLAAGAFTRLRIGTVE